MRKILKKISLLICSCLIAICTLCITIGNKDKISTPIRDVELQEQNVEVKSCFEKFDSYKLDYMESNVNFVGYDIINLSDLGIFDLVSDEKLDVEVTTKYSCSYDYENGIVALSVSLLNVEEISLIDTIYGIVIMNEELKYDVVFDCDGETLLLSDIQNNGMIDNCGLWAKIKKVWNTTSGKIGTIATVATCAVVGTVCAIVPGGELVTAACVGVAVGALGGTITAAVSTYISEGAIDWESVGCYAIGGAVIGGVTSAVSYGVTTAIKSAITKTCTSKPIGADSGELEKIAKNSIKSCDLNKQSHILQSKHAWTTVCDGKWDNVSKIIQKTIVDGNAAECTNTAGNIIFTLPYNGQTISVTTRIVDGVLKIVDAWVVL